MIIGFCTQIYDRLWQLEQTFFANLQTLTKTNHIWLIHVYPGTDGTVDFLQAQQSHPNLKIRIMTSPYDIITAKQIVHTEACDMCDYVMNIDCDNFIGSNTIELIENNPDMGLHNYNPNVTGTYGRIGIPSDMFISLGGYDTTLRVAGVHDVVLVHKLTVLGRIQTSNTIEHQPIPNTKDDTIKYHTESPTVWAQHVLNNWKTFFAQGWFIYPDTITFSPIERKSGKLESYPLSPKHMQRIACMCPVHTLQYHVTFSEQFNFTDTSGVLPGWGGSYYSRTKSQHSVLPAWTINGNIFLGTTETLPRGVDERQSDVKFRGGETYKIMLRWEYNTVQLTVNDTVVDTAPLRTHPITLLYHVCLLQQKTLPVPHLVHIW